MNNLCLPNSARAREILEPLNEPQREAVLHFEGPLLVLAGAGSGKTRVITHRIAFLLCERNIKPWNILAMTFTNKAAAEMRDRVDSLLGGSSSGLTLLTFHSFGARVLRKYSDHAGLSPDYTIYDDKDSEMLVKRILMDFKLDPKKLKPSLVLSLINRAKDRLISPDLFWKLGSECEGPIFEYVSEIYPEYEKRLRRSNAVNFADLLYMTVRMLENSGSVLKELRNKYRFLMVDEYQDTNHSQFRLCELISEESRNIVVVGDDDQAIYGWRGADVRNILGFEKDFPEAKVIKLEQNYRSTPEILRVANIIVQENHGRRGKRLWTGRASGVPVKIHQLFDEYDEARFIADEIGNLLERGYKFSDIAVFYRVHSLSRVLEDVFRQKEIPFKVVGSVGFYHRKEIKDILAYLKLVVNPSDDVSIMRIINVPARGIGETTLRKAREISLERGVSLYEVLTDLDFLETLRDATRRSINSFFDMVQEFREASAQLSVSRLIERILSSSKYIDHLRDENSIESLARIDNLNEFISVASEFENRFREGITLRTFLNEMALLTDLDSLPEDQDFVTLMTLHTAKGLEFSCVFMCAMEESIFPHSRSSFDVEEMREERRLCYVGLTRARDRLYLTHAGSRMVYGNRDCSEPSPFLTEIKLGIQTEISKAAEEEQAAEKQVPADSERVFDRGDLVRHRIWGQGKIISRRGMGSDAVYRIKFQGGNEKTLMHRYANLQPANKV